MDSYLPLPPAISKLIKVSGVIAFTLTWFADFAAVLSMNPDPFGTPTTWLPVVVTGPLIGLSVLGTPRAPALRKRIIAAVTLSLALTVWSLIQPPDITWWGALETCGLLCLTVRATAQPWRPVTAAAWAAVLGITTLLLPLRPGSQHALVAGTYSLTVALAVCVALGCAARALEMRRERAVHDVRQAERLALARDLHDLIAHHITGIIVQANAALTIQATAPDAVDPILRNIAGSGTETLESMRRLVRVLREDDHAALRPGDLLTELADLVSAHSAAGPDDSPARLDLTAAARTTRLSPEVELSVLRLVQEALTNIRRHAPGAPATVHLDVAADRFQATVTNTAPPGRAASPAGGRGGFGLLGLCERVEALDGTLHAGPLSHGGWQVQAVFPLVPAVGTLMPDAPPPH
ncbi:histidine kinase [Streptomyces sp. NPDC059832]|uniref:ATP-binding protein n=1 Tax=unclassified Streptomyces TaxID=2593676 RepID=UPI00365739FE